MVTTVNSTVGEFVVRRLIRIVPLYWLFTLLLVALYALAPGGLHSTVISPETLTKSLLFVPHYSLGHPGEIWPILVPGWTLNYEMFFYLVFALLIVFSPLVRVTLAVLVFVPLAFAGWLLGDAASDAVLRTYTSPRLLE